MTTASHAKDTKALRAALGRFATGVAVITARDADGPVGLTVNSFSSVSLEPPLVLFSVARTARSLTRLEKVDSYVVNILRHGQHELSSRFARAGVDKWAGAQPEIGLNGAPVLLETLARFECRPYGRHDAGDHVIFIGEVTHFEAAEDGDPLLFYRGGYRSLAPPG